MNASGVHAFPSADALTACRTGRDSAFCRGEPLELKKAAQPADHLGHIGCGGRIRTSSGAAGPCSCPSVATADCYANKRQAMAAVCKGTPTPIFANCSRATLTPW